jgi:hypothetical protein
MAEARLSFERAQDHYNFNTVFFSFLKMFIHFLGTLCIYLLLLLPFGHNNFIHPYNTPSAVCGIFMCPVSPQFITYNLHLYTNLLTVHTINCGVW